MRTLAATCALSTLTLAAATAGAHQPLQCEAPEPLPALAHWPPDQRQAYADYEAALNATASPERLMQWHELLACEPHVAGTDGDRRTVERIAAAFEGMGLEVERHEIWVYLCRPVAATLEVIDADGTRTPLGIKESPIDGDTFTENPELWPGWNAWSGSGDVTAEVVYANYGTKADFEKLAELGIDVRGKVVLARYGGNFRGYKVKFAQAAGAAAVVIFTDPADTGYMKGLMYPEGGYQTETCIQRGGVATLPYSGDPLTPFVEATKDAKRQDPKSVDLPTIPVQPVGWAAAKEILARMKGPAVPQGWQGGLPLPYRLTGGEGGPKVRVHVEQKREIAQTWNILGTLRGEKHPDQMVIVGSHHDAWGFGASDPLAGTIVVLESARCFAEQARAGHRPDRSIVFAAWGAEEFGIIGSVEWVEANRDRLFTSAVAYINLDMASMGPDFGASASPSLRRLIADCARVTPQARAPDRTVLDAWLARAPDPRIPGLPLFGDVGGGSDHVGFLCHTLVPSAGLGAGGSPGTAWHTTRDTLQWYWKVVGPDYEPALMVTRMTNAIAARLACAPMLPLDPARPLVDMRRALMQLTDRSAARGKPSILTPSTSPDGRVVTARELADLDSRAGRIAQRAAAVEARLLAAVARGDLADSQLGQTNRLLMALDRAWIRPQGIPGRPWFRNLQAATDEDSGYAAWVLPALARAIERNDAPELQRALPMYDGVLNAIEGVLDGLETIADRTDASRQEGAPEAGQ